jgi:hypothetical protein
MRKKHFFFFYLFPSFLSISLNLLIFNSNRRGALSARSSFKLQNTNAHTDTSETRESA